RQDRVKLKRRFGNDTRRMTRIYLKIARRSRSDDSAHRRAMGTHPESFSGRAHPRWTSWTQADPDPRCVRSCIVDPQHRRCRDEVLRRVLTDVANELRDKGALDEEECFIDATFVMAKGGGAEIGPTKRGKGMKIMAIVDRHGLPLSVSTHAANHHEVRLVQLCFDFYM